MIEKVNPKHPDKVADRIAGAIVDLSYELYDNPKVAVEVLIGHDKCSIIIETTASNLSDGDLSTYQVINNIVNRIAEKELKLELTIVPQDVNLNKNQQGEIRTGDNGIFKGVESDDEQKFITLIAKDIYEKYQSDGKYILDLDAKKLIVCQSNANTEELTKWLQFKYSPFIDTFIVNPLGDWTGGVNVDTGATNRKLGSDMGSAVTGGGLHGKDVTKTDVSINIWLYLLQNDLETLKELALEIEPDFHRQYSIFIGSYKGGDKFYNCAIGDEYIDNIPYSLVTKIVKKYIDNLGGFEKLAEWGLV